MNSLPWKIYGNARGRLRRVNIVDSKGRAVTTAADPVDALLIVGAVNAHDDLVAVVKHAIAAIDAYPQHKHPMTASEVIFRDVLRKHNLI